MFNNLFSRIAMTATAKATEALTDVVTEPTVANGIDFEPAAFVSSLKYMAAGMAGIFLVIGTIILTIVILSKLTASKKSNNGNNEE